MTTAEVDALVRDVMVPFGLRFTVLSAVGSPLGTAERCSAPAVANSDRL
jgi:hypothetical protein